LHSGIATPPAPSSVEFSVRAWGSKRYRQNGDRVERSFPSFPAYPLLAIAARAAGLVAVAHQAGDVAVRNADSRVGGAAVAHARDADVAVSAVALAAADRRA